MRPPESAPAAKLPSPMPIAVAACRYPVMAGLWMPSVSDVYTTMMNWSSAATPKK